MFADVRVEAQVETMVRTTTQRFGRLDVAFVAGLGGFGEITELAKRTGTWSSTCV
jgi:NAD(P)-dependent dehydrogenase (short-subunit alcohol dehydrogenase family)